MNKIVKKGFTLVELLFVMAIIAILAGFAISNLKDSTRIAVINSMKHDAKNIISQQNIVYAEQQEYDSFGFRNNSADPMNMYDHMLIQSPLGYKYALSKDNGMSTYEVICPDGYSPDGTGLFVIIEHYKPGGDLDIDYPIVVYNSCFDGNIRMYKDVNALNNGESLD